MKKYINHILLLLYTLFNLDFFSYNRADFGLFVTIVNMVPILLLGYRLLIDKTLKRGYFTGAVCVFILSMILAAIPASIYHYQGFLDSIRTSGRFYPFFMYLFLIQVDYSKKEILQVVKVFFWATLVVFVIDVKTFPDSIFGWRIWDLLETRGSFSFIFFGQGFTVLGAFFYLRKFLLEKKILYLLPFIIAVLFMAFLTGARSYIIGLLAGSLFMILMYFIKAEFSPRKIIMLIIIFAVFSSGIIYGKQYITNFMDITQEQLGDYDSDTRNECIKFYSGEFQKNIVTKILGNGYPRLETPLGQAFAQAEDKGFYTSDIGIVGVWTHFGLLAVLAWVLIFKKAFRKDLLYQNLFIVAFFIYLLTNSIFTYTLFDGGYILSYIYAIFLYEETIDESSEEEMEKVNNYNLS